MTPRLSPGPARRLLFSVSLAVFVAPVAAVAGAQDPFEPALRWTHSAPASHPWLPETAVFAAQGSFVWAGAKGAHPRLMLLDRAAAAQNPPRFVDSRVAGAVGAIHVAGGGPADAVFSAWQMPGPSVQERRSLVARHDPLAAAQGDGFGPVWIHDVGLLSNGPCRLAADEAGELVVMAAWDDGRGEARVDWLAAGDGALLFRRQVPAAALRHVLVSADGSRVVVATSDTLFLFDRQANLLHQRTLNGGLGALALSGDGRTLLVGSFGSLEVLHEGGGEWIVAFVVSASSQWLAYTADVSRDGTTFGLGWWNHQSGVDVRLEVWDAGANARRIVRHQSGTAGGLQNLPQAVRITPDGRRVAFGTWGGEPGTPELLLFDRDQPEPLMALDLPGSVRALDLDSSGTRLLVAYKDAHANQFATTGGLRLYDTGERSVQLLDAPEVGGELRVVARGPAGATTFFLVGPPASGPLLHVARTSLRVFGRVADLDGRADLALPIPPSPALIGTRLATQAAWRDGGAITLSVAFEAPWILSN